MTYGYCLWFYKNSPCKNHIKLINKTQHQAALWITGAFCTSHAGGVETIAGLLPVHLQLRKLKNKFFLHNKKLHSSHPTISLFSLLWEKGRGRFSIDKLTPGQQQKFKSPINEDNYQHSCIEDTFTPYDPEAWPGHRLCDLYASCIHYNLPILRSANTIKNRISQLDGILNNSRLDSTTVCIGTDGSILFFFYLKNLVFIYRSVQNTCGSRSNPTELKTNPMLTYSLMQS